MMMMMMMMMMMDDAGGGDDDDDDDDGGGGGGGDGCSCWSHLHLFSSVTQTCPKTACNFNIRNLINLSGTRPAQSDPKEKFR